MREIVSFNIPKTLLVLLLSLIFIGQAMASSLMPYHMMNMAGMKSYQHPQGIKNIEHHSHQASHKNIDQVVSDNNVQEKSASVGSVSSKDHCCIKTKHCKVSMCSTIAALVQTEISTSITTPFYTKIQFTSDLVLSQSLTSLYRPPILS